MMSPIVAQLICSWLMSDKLNIGEFYQEVLEKA
jgi:hypothetical protein